MDGVYTINCTSDYKQFVFSFSNMEDSLGQGESQNYSVNPYFLLEDQGTTSHCDLKKMEKQGDESDAEQNVLQNVSEELCKIVPECIQGNSATKLSDVESVSKGSIMSRCGNEDMEKGKGVEGIEQDGENIHSEAGCEDSKIHEFETSSKKSDVDRENDDLNENGDSFEGVKEVTGSHSTTHEGDVNERNEEKAAGIAVLGDSESNVNSDSRDFKNEENNQNMSSFILEGEENEDDKSMNISGLEGDENRKDIQNMISFDSSGDDNDISLYLSSSSEMEVSENEEARQAMSNSVTEDDDNEETSQTINSSSFDDSESEDISQSTVKSDLQDSGDRENNQSLASSGLESEENSQMCNSGMESNENENYQMETGYVIKGNENENTMTSMEKDDRMVEMNEDSSEMEHDMSFHDSKKDNVLNEEDIQENDKEGSTEVESDKETKKNTNSCVIQEQLEDFTKETQGCLEAESRLKDTQEDSMERSLEEKISESNDSAQNAERSEDQDLRTVTEEGGKDAELEIVSRKEKDGELQSEAEQEEMETEVSRVEGEEEGENKGSTVQGKDEENKTPTGVESGKLCEKEQLETEGRNINMKKMSANIENDKTQKSLDKETEQSKKGDADTSRSKGWITTGDHDEPDKDAHDSGQPDMNEQSLKLTSEIRSKPNQGKTYTNMHEETLSEDVQNQTGANKITGKDVDQLKRLAVTKDVLNQADKHGIADKDVSEKANTTSQESTPEETPQNQKEEIGSESQEIEKNGIGYGSREDEKLSKEVMVQQNTTTSQLSKESEHPGGEISSKCDDSRTMKHKDVAPTCERKPSSSSSKNTVTDKKMPPKQKNIAKKSTSKKTPGGAVHKQQPSTEKTLSEEQDVGDSNDSDIVILSETIKTIENTDRSDQMSLVCQRCYYLWNDEVLEAIFEGNKSVTVNSKITYGAIMCFSNYADIHYPENKEKALRSVLERADLGKSIGNMKIKEVVVWLKCLMKSGSVSCCTVFDAVYNPKSADMMLSALLSPKPASQKENEVQKSKQPSTSMVDEETPKQKSSLTKTKHKAGPSSETITPSTNTTGAEKITLSQQSEVKKDPDTTAKSSVNTQVKELKAGLKKKDMHLSEAPATSYGDDSQSLNKKIIIKKCSVNLGKPVPITSKHRVRIYPVWKSSLKRSIIGEEVMRQSMKKRKNLGCKESTGTESLSESSDKNDAELPMNEPPTTDCSKYVSKDSFHDSDKDDTMSEWRESNMNASRNEESSLENSSDIVTTKPSNKKSVTESEQSTADVKGDIVVKDQVKAEGYKKDKTTLRNKSKIGARHNNKDIKYSSRKKKFGKINDKDADQILPQKSEASTDDDVSNIIKSKDDSRNTGKHDLQSTKAINRNEKPEEAIIKHDKCERNEEANKTDTVSESCEKNEETVDVSAKKSEDVNTEKTGDFNSKKTKDVNIEKAGDLNTEKIGDVNTEKTGDVDTEKTGDVNTEKTGDVNTEKTEDVNTKKIGDVNTEKTEDVNTKKIGDVNTEKIGDVNTEKTGDVNTEKTGDVNTEKTGDVNTEKTGDVNTEKTGDVNTEKTINTEKTGDVCAEKTDVNNKKTEDVNADKKETEKRDKTEETVIRNMKDAKAGHEKYERNERDMEDVKFESNERSEDSIMREADTKRYEETKIGEVNMIDAEQVLTEKQIVSTVELVGNTAEHEDVSERVSGNTEPEDVNMKDAKEQTVTEKQDMSSGNSFTNQVKRSAEGPSIHSSKKQKVSDRVREKSPRDTEIQEAKDLTAVMEGVPSKPQRKTRTRTETRRLCSTDSKESESSMPASFEGLQSSLSSEMTPNGDSSDEYDKNTSKERRVCKEKMEEKILKSPRILKSRSQRAISKKFVSSSETSSDSNDLPVSKNDSVPQLRTRMNYQPVSSAINNEETGNILVQKLGLDINAIDLYCNTTDSKIPTNRDMANMPRQRGRLTKALEAMLRERSDLDGVAKEAFDLLPFEHHNLLGIANNRERYLTNQELLVLQNICVLNPEAPDVDMFYQILIQVLLARRRVLMVPNSLALLVVTEKIRREFNRAKRKGNHSEYLAQDWDPCKIYTTEDFWIAEKKPPKVPTVRTVLSIFCLWKNMEKRVPISLPIALEELCRNLVLWDVDKIGICVKLYSRYCTFLYEEKNPSLTEIFLNQPFVGSKTKLQKKLLYSKEDSSKDTTENLSLKHNKNVIENDVQALLKQCLEAEQAALHSSNPSEEEWFRKCVQALKAKVDLYKKDIQLIQKVTKDTEKKKFQLLSNLNSSEYEDLPQDLGKTTETLYRLLAKITTKFEMIKEAECMAAKETNKVPRLSSSALKAADLGEDISENMKDLVYELLLNKVGVEEMRPVLCSIVENMTDKNISVVPSNSWIRNFARITGLKVRSRSSVV